MFRDRIQAAQLLTQSLMQYRGKKPLVLAIPRGGVPLGRYIADKLEGELDVVMVRKLGSPMDPELAIGAVSEGGDVYITTNASRLGANEEYIESEVGNQLSLIHRRRAQYTPVRPPISPKNRIVIVVDDGLATGATMLTALRSLQSLGPERVICAIPVAPANTLDPIREYCDELICLNEAQYFSGVGSFYQDFSQVDDSEVIALLRGGDWSP